MKAESAINDFDEILKTYLEKLEKDNPTSNTAVIVTTTEKGLIKKMRYLLGGLQLEVLTENIQQGTHTAAEVYEVTEEYREGVSAYFRRNFDKGELYQAAEREGNGTLCELFRKITDKEFEVMHDVFLDFYTEKAKFLLNGKKGSE